MSLLTDIQHSFRRQIILVLALFSCLLSFVWASALFGGIQWTEDHLLNKQLAREFYRLEDNLPQEIANKTLLRNWLNVYSDILPTGMIALLSEDVPEEFQGYLVENEATEAEGQSIHFYKGQVGDYSITIIVEEFLVSQHSAFEPMLISLLVMLALAMLIISIWLARALGNRLAAPLVELTQSLSTQSIPDDLAAMQRKDEIGTLGRTFNQLLARLNQFLVREKQFTRHASHEMRTPVSIIANSLSVLKLTDIDEQKRQRNLQRIEQAVDDISQLIETFLMLGREDDPHRNDCRLCVNHLLKNKMAEHQKDDMQCELTELTKLYVFADERLVNIMLDNILINSFRYGKSRIEIVVKQGSLDITNDIGEESDTHGGFGFGLEIVRRICTLFQWQCQTSYVNEQFSLQIHFAQNA